MTETSPIIDFVCTGNHGRSPVAERIAKNYLNKIGADGAYGAISSGTSVDELLAGSEPIKTKIGVIELGKQNDVYKRTDIALIDIAIKNANEGRINEMDKQVIDAFYETAKRFLNKEELEHRAEAMKHFGIEGALKGIQEQTIARPDALAVLSMAPSNNQKVIQIYAGSGYNPTIGILSAFATGNPNAQLPNTYGKGKEAYFKGIEVLMDHVPKAIDNLIK